jgi:hypothetical protein
MMPRPPSDPRGFSSIEAVFALAILGLSLLGISTTTINQVRLMESVERRVHILAPPGTEVAVSYPSGAQLPEFSVVDTEATLVNRARRWAGRLSWPRLRSHDVRYRRGSVAGPFTIRTPETAWIDRDPLWTDAALSSRFDISINAVDLASGTAEMTLTPH